MSELKETLDLNKLIDEFEDITTNVENVQKQILKEILEKNQNTVYLQKYSVNGDSDVKDFKARVPIVTHADIDPYIQRMVNGDNTPLLTYEPITMFAMSSGTTEGRRKYLPVNEYFLDNTMKIFQTGFAYRDREFPVGNGKVLQFLYTGLMSVTKGGASIAPCTTNIYRSPKFKPTMKSIRAMYSCPDEVILCPDFQQTTYCHLLSALLCRDEIQYVFALFGQTIFQAFKTFEKDWEDIVADIKDGVLSSKITDPFVREAMLKLLTSPNPELADSIRTICTSLNNWSGLIPALFPKAKYVYGIMTGPAEPYLNKLKHYAGDLPLISHDYGGSEGWIAMNVTPSVRPEDTVYTVFPDVGFFEFLPLGKTFEENEEPVGLADVKVGEVYEIIITNHQGLYRYKMGDVVKVVGFYNKTPQLKYMYRRHLVLSITVDKTTEKDLQLAVEAASKKLSEEKIEVMDYTSRVDMSTEPGHYVIFLEVSSKATDHILRECSNILDKAFIDGGYILGRTRNEISPLELIIVEEGTFKKIQQHLVRKGTSAGQLKLPRCVPRGDKEFLEILSENLVSRFFSTAYP